MKATKHGEWFRIWWWHRGWRYKKAWLATAKRCRDTLTDPLIWLVSCFRILVVGVALIGMQIGGYLLIVRYLPAERQAIALMLVLAAAAILGLWLAKKIEWPTDL